MIEVDGKNYELKYNMKTIEQIEAATGKPLVANIRESNGLLGLSDLKIYFSLALFNDEGKRVSPAQGIKIAEEIMISSGYSKLVDTVIVAIERDCPFLFQVD